MKLSVIMAVYNGEKYLKNAIESILNQTFRDFEFLIVEDGSIDNSLKIINEFALKDKRIKIIRNSINIGLTKSLNRAIKVSKGEFIARQDVDDISISNRLEIQLNFLINNKDYAFCGCNGTMMENGKKILKFFDLKTIHKNLIVENCFIHPSIVIRKQIFEDYSDYNEKYLYSQDYELWCRLIYKYKLKAKNLEDDLIIMNFPIEHLTSKKKKKFLIQRKNDIRTRLRYLKYSENKIKGIFSILKNSIEILYVLIFSRNRD